MFTAIKKFPFQDRVNIAIYINIDYKTAEISSLCYIYLKIYLTMCN